MATIKSSIPRPDPKARSPVPYARRRRNSAPSTPATPHSYLPVPSATASCTASRSPRDSGIAFVLNRPQTPPSALPIRLEARTSRLACVSRVLLTPSSVASQTSHAEKELSPSARKLQTLTPRSSPYMSPHISDPCTTGSLVHHLHPCGHKVITRSPVPCASNCLREYNEKTLRWANAVITKEGFVCAACVQTHIQEHRSAQLRDLKDRFARTEARMGPLDREWLKQQIAYGRGVLENDIEKEVKEFGKLGRPCSMIPGEPLIVTEKDPIRKLNTVTRPRPSRPSPKGDRVPGTAVPKSLLYMPRTRSGAALHGGRPG